MMSFGVHAASPPPHMLTGVRFPTLVRLNERTADGRLIRNTGFSVRDLPLSFSTMFTTMHGFPGEAPIVGSLDEVTIEDDGTVWGMGWLMDMPEGHKAGRMIQAQALRGNSIELAVEEYEVDIDWDKMELNIDFIKCKLSATTLVANPAMEGCTVELELDDFDFGAAEADEPAMVASLVSLTEPREHAFAFSVTSPVRETAAGDPEPVQPAPPAEWFAEQDWMDEFTPIRVDEPDANGFRHVWGYLFDWDTPHVGMAEAGVTFRAPHSRTDYAYFANGEVLADDGTFIAVGRLVLGCKHADERLGWREAARHYDDSGRCWASVAIFENKLGGAVNGYVLPSVSDEDVAVARALGTSGDWRHVGAGLELIAGLSVNAEGYPKPRPKAYAIGGRQFSLLNAGYVQPRWEAERASGRFLSDGMIRDMQAVGAFADRQELAEIRSALLADQQREMAEIGEGL
jgi:hypothetical protein